MINSTRKENIALVELAHGKVNAMDVEFFEELTSLLDEIEKDEKVSALVVTGSGPAFSAGIDLRRVLSEPPEYTRNLLPALSGALERLFVFPKPTVAAINGAAVAGGCILACACDRRLIAEKAKIGASELVVGVPFPAVPLEILRAACGPYIDEVVLGGPIVDAERAVSLGLAHRVVPAEELADRAWKSAQELAALEPEAFRLAKLQLRRPAIDLIRVGSASMDADVTDQWVLPQTRMRIQEQLDRLARR